MRIQRLDLIAFGPFTDESLEFSQQGPGLQIVYGPNEAGKSSSLRAITDLLFGIHARSKEDFVHPYAKLKLGARILDSKGKPFDFVRLKKNKNSLQSPDESESYPDDALDRFLGNVNRDLFVSMFGIDHERLRAGGEEIVQGKGDIGELLFSAGAGLTNLRTLQGELVEQSDRLLKPPPGRSGEIAEQIKTYGVYRAELRDLQVSVDTWKSLTAARDACETRKANLDEAIKKVRTQQNRLQRLGDAIPLIGRWRALSDELKYLGDAPILTGDFAERSQKRLQDLRVDEQRHSAASQKLKELKAELAGLSVTEELLCRADEIKQLVESLGAHRKALRDQPRLIQTVEFNEHEIIEILKKLGREPDVSKLDQLRVPKMQQERIQKLGNQQEFILSQPKVHQKECERLRREHARVEKKIAETTVPPELDRLRHAVRDAMSKGDLEEQLEALLDEIAELEQQAATCLTQLPFWDGPLSEIARMEVPFPATVDQYQDRFKDQESAIRQLEKEIAKTEREYEQLEIDLQSLEATHRIPTLEELEQTRSLREAGFELIIQAWREGKATEEEIEAYIKQRESAEDLETAYRSYVDEADQIADQLRAGAEQVANKQKLIAERMRSERQLASLHDQLEKAREVRRDCEEEWNLVWEPLNIAPGTPAEMKEWLRARQEIAALVGHLEAKQRDADRVQNQIDTHREKLANLLTEIDSQSISRAATLEELISAANDSLDENERRISQLAQWREELGKLETGLEEAESELAQAEQDRDEWLANWSKAVKVIGLGGDAQADEANSLLSDLSSIFEKYQEDKKGDSMALVCTPTLAKVHM
ncbi:MAG: hypothetical protein CMJ46_07970, partial [Planctomyces sp.]|nr:hypothetical protein [Planctomyces sp.]